MSNGALAMQQWIRAHEGGPTAWDVILILAGNALVVLSFAITAALAAWMVMEVVCHLMP